MLHLEVSSGIFAGIGSLSRLYGTLDSLGSRLRLKPSHPGPVAIDAVLEFLDAVIAAVIVVVITVLIAAGTSHRPLAT